MRNHARAVVIGGGVVGVSTLYHLVKKGWTDSVLFERKELTSGSTWHAAGLLPLFNLSYSVGQLHKYSVALYKRRAPRPGWTSASAKSPTFAWRAPRTGSTSTAIYAGVAATIGGIEVKFLTPARVARDLAAVRHRRAFGCEYQHPGDGYIQPADLTQALARGARDGGGEINRQTVVKAIERTAERRVARRHRQGRRHLRARDFRQRQFRQTHRRDGRARRSINARPAPIHRHRSASGHPGARKAAGLPEMGVLRESDSSWYMREEAGGLLLGPYELGAPACYLDGDRRRRANTNSSRKTSNRLATDV